MRNGTTLVLLCSLVLLFHSAPAPAGPLSPEAVLSVPWGADPATNVRFQIEPGSRYGPQSFRVDPASGAVSILDPLNGSLKVYQSGSLVETLASPRGTRDFFRQSGSRFVYLIDNQLATYEGDRLVARTTRNTTPPVIQNISGETGRGLQFGSKYYEVRKRSSSLAEIVVTGVDGVETTLSLPVARDNLGCIRVVGADARDRIFLDIDLVLRAVPLMVQREVWVVTGTGDVIGKIEIPLHYFTQVFRDLELHDNGNLYHMISSRDGIHIFRWLIPDSDAVFRGEYPAEFREPVHYNFLEFPEIPDSEVSLDAVQLVTRSEAAAIGDTYIEHVWTCTEANISNGVVVAPDADLVETPDWIQVGSNQTIPYKWGGFDTLAEFDAGMTAGDFAGDIQTDGSSDYARGVDCSGFVSQCWKSATHWTSWMMDDPAYGPITLPYSSWEELQTGDAIQRHGHVRMAIGAMQNGVILTIESAGTPTGFKVGYNAYTYSGLVDFSPRYYIHMDGAPVQTTTASAGSGPWTTGSTWVGGVVPDTTDHVEIQSGHTISVDNNNAVCKDLSFAADDALIDMNANSMLTVYGNVALASASHIAFSAGWSATNAYIRFAGAAVQTLSGWNTSGGSTSFRDVIIDKNGGRVTTDGNNMRLGVQNSLEIMNGELELAEQDDIEGRWASSGNFTGNPLPNVTVRAGGKFTMLDGAGAHHIRSGVGTPIGSLVVEGEAQFRDASSLLIILNGVAVEDGGTLRVSVGMGGGEFICGTVTVKNGAVLENYTTSDCWGPGAVVILENGGMFDTKTETTIFPTSFVNNGTVRYSRDSGTDQTIVDMDYHRLEVSLDSGVNKIWTPAGNRAIADELEVNNSANLVLEAASARSLTVGASLRMTSGTIDNSDNEVSLVVADGAAIVRATGTVAVAPVFVGTADVRYVSTMEPVTTGPELPAASNVLNGLLVTGTEGVTLGADVTVNGACTISGSALTTGSYTLTLGPAATLSEADSITVVGNATTTRTLSQSVNEDFGGLGLEVNAAGGPPGVTTVLRVTGTAQSINGTDGILRYFDVTPANNTGLDATMVIHYDQSELNFIDEVDLRHFSFDGSPWTDRGGTVNEAANTVAITGIDGLSTHTLGPTTVTAVDGGGVPEVTRLVSVYPNPFNPTAKIMFDVREATNVNITVYDVMGRTVRTLKDEILPASRYTVEWRGVNDSGSPAASGIYFCRMVAGDVVQTRKMVLIK